MTNRILANNYRGVVIEVFANDDHSYETLNFFEKIVNHAILIPILSSLPSRIGKTILTKSSSDALKIYQYTKTSRALEILYTYRGKITFTGTFLDSFFTYLWHRNIENAKAVRNRFKLVKKELQLAIEEIYQKIGATVKIFSLASGSARTVIETLAEHKESVKAEARLLDLSSDALALSKKLAMEYGIVDVLGFYQDKVSNFFEYCEEWQPNIIEMVGFLDYLTQDKAIQLSKLVYRTLAPNGIFITANIRDNHERKFITKVFNWDMIYRSEQELTDVLLEGGFEPGRSRVIYEPNLIHGVAIGRK